MHSKGKHRQRSLIFPTPLSSKKWTKTNKATELDQIDAKLLKDYASSFVSCLTKIFNTPLFSQTFPDIWKKGKIVPLYKS